MSDSARKRRQNRFGATSPPFIDYLKDILRRYPDGGQILKELIQNADDACATEMVFIFDERNYGTETLWSEDLKKYQGPAMYAYNNSIFSEDDWRGIQTTGRSVKRNDPNKVGRFGIGFNSVYHITDMPSIFSGKHLGMLDPQEKIFGEKQGGNIWSLDENEDREELLSLCDQVQPLRDVLGQFCTLTWEEMVNKEKHFPGTLFRFPLRMEPSDISETLYDSEKMFKLFKSFSADADMSLLFLRHVTSISLIHVDSQGAANLHLQATASMPSVSNIEGSTCLKDISYQCSDQPEKRCKWLVTVYFMTEGLVPDLDILAEKLSFSPQVGLAFPWDCEKTLSNGRLSCFLPLPNNEPNKTGLPLHLNACFGLTDNRRHIKWQEEDQKYDEAALWNELLVEKVLPLAYHKIILDAIELSKHSVFPVSSVYKLWPDIHQMKYKEKWLNVVMQMLQPLLELSVLYLAGDEKRWVRPAEALFLPNNNGEPSLMKAIAAFLIREGKPLVTIPTHVSEALRSAFESPESLTLVSPALVRNILRQSDMTSLSRDDKLFLLEYVLSDGCYPELRGLQLLPLSDGSFECFTENGFALIENQQFPRCLLPGYESRFVPKDLRSNILQHLMQLQSTRMFRIFNLDASVVTALAMKSLPKLWQESSGHVTWEIGNMQHPPMQWLQQFWNFLRLHEELHPFVGMPLIPLAPLQDDAATVTLARLMDKTTLMCQKSKQASLPDGIAAVISKTGGTLISIRDKCLKHTDLDMYILTPSPANILQLFLSLETDEVIHGITISTFQEKEKLKSYLSNLDSFTQDVKQLLLKLPLFQQMPSLTCRTEEFLAAGSKQAVMLHTLPAIPGDILMPKVIIKCETKADQRILSMLNIDLLDVAKAAIILVSGIEKDLYDIHETEKIMSWILENGSFLFHQEQILYGKCRNLSFIVTNGRGPQTASSLFDPCNETFQVLFESKFFPPPVFTNTPKMLVTLRQLGLQCKEEEISPSDALIVAKQINNLQSICQEEAFRKAEALIRICNLTDVLSKFSAQQIGQLVCIEWIPCHSPGFKNENHKTQTVECFYKPDDLRDSKYKNIVGFVMPVTDKLIEKASSKLGLLRLPPAEKVFENLSFLTTMEHGLHPDTDDQFKEMLHCMYKYMQTNILQLRNLIVDTDEPWVWVYNQFVFPRDVVLRYPSELDLSCYIKRVPEEFLRYTSLLKVFGVKESFSNGEIVDILYRIKLEIDGRHRNCGSPSELKLPISILNWMRKNRVAFSEDLPIPVRQGNEGEFNLQPLSCTVFCDISKEGLEDLREDKEEFHVIHKEIPQATAQWLNVPLLSTRILHPELIGIVQCGQMEPITLRIKNILKEYDEEHDLFKELIQNAEDAGAQMCNFMVDNRQNSDSLNSLIDPNMSSCHGPCLWAFNNEQFTEEDWLHITQIGSDSKDKQVEKIGKFGLGFNAVYHVTDIPSILSGKHLVIFDPNVTHLKKHISSKGNPGIKLDLFKERLLRRFPGQFKPYEGIYGCNLETISNQKLYEGTLIKLPFRTQVEAQTSEISKKVYSGEHVKTLVCHLKQYSQILLLFLKKLCKLSLDFLPESASTPPQDEEINMIVTVTRNIVSTISIPDDFPLRKMQRNSIQFLAKLDKKCEEVIDGLLANIVEVSMEAENVEHVKYWLIYSCFGMHRSLELAVTKASQQNFSLPVGSVAVPLQKDQTLRYWEPDKSKLDGNVFCFLPLSISSGLPVHVNGSFAVTSNRKSLWETGVKHEWNQALIEDSVTTAYITALIVLKKMYQEGKLQNYDYYTFWPDRKEVRKSFQPLISAFYSAIAEPLFGKPIELFSDGENWCSIDNATFLHPEIQNNKKVGPMALQAFCNNLKKPCLAIPLPQWVRDSFQSTRWDKAIQDKTFGWLQFYREIVFNNLSSMEASSRNALVLHAIDMNDEAVDDLLMSHACIPTQGAMQLQFIGKLVHPLGKVACLYEVEEGRFLEGTEKDFLSQKRILRLLDLGMLNNSLPLADLAERAETISEIWEQDRVKAYRRVCCILDLAHHTLHEAKSDWDALRNTPFIPACCPYVSNDKEIALHKAEEVYSYEYQNLVSMSEPTVDKEHLSPYLHSSHVDKVLDHLGVLHEPPLETVLLQLQRACLHSEVFEENRLTCIANQCYNYLEIFLKKETKSKMVFARAQQFPFILIENKFVHVAAVAKNVSFDARPYLYELPWAFSKFTNLWNSVGIKDQFTSQEYMSVLKQMENAYKGAVLSACDLDISLQIVNVLHEFLDNHFKEYLLPDKSGVLRPSSKLNYNDTPWLPVAEGVILCHDRISRSTALCLKVRTTCHHTLQNHLVPGYSPFAMEFGQREKLTVRIKNIIAAYPSKKDILKELIQNADDAQATEIHFVWDGRSHKTTKTFGEKWNPLQGPALCVYNNTVFSDTDLKGIQQLGEGGKKSASGTTGKYGLGFNSVYHLTDCPAILTGDKWLCISDPHLKYVDNGTEMCPGSKYSLQPEFIETFVDVYNTFLPTFFDLDQGTMFRLPIRTNEMAGTSEISNKEVTLIDIRELLQALQKDPEDLILFLRHIKKIEFQQYSSATELQNLFSVEIKLPEDSSTKKVSFQNHVLSSLTSQSTAEPIGPFQVIYPMEVLSSGKKPSQWIMAEKCGSSSKTCSGRTNVPCGAVAACVNGHIKGKAFCGLPLPGETGLPVHVNGNFEVDFSRRDLWKEDGRSMKTNWNELLKLEIIAPLYADLLNYIRASCIKGSQSSLDFLCHELELRYLNFFPHVSDSVSQEWQGLIQELYKSIHKRGLSVIPVLHTSIRKCFKHILKQYTVSWSTTSNAEPTEAPHFTPRGSKRFLEILEDIGINLVPYSCCILDMFNSFKRAGVEVLALNPKAVRNYLKKKPLNDPRRSGNSLPLPISQTLVKNKLRCKTLVDYCLSDINKTNSSSLSGLPLLLTHDQVLRSFQTDSPKFFSRFVILFQGLEENFAEDSLYLKHFEVLHEAKVLKELNIPVSTSYLKEILQRHLQDCAVDPQTALHIPDKNLWSWLKLLWQYIDDQVCSTDTKDSKKNKAFSDAKLLFSDSPIIPVLCPSQNGKHLLATVKALSIVVFESIDQVISILFKLGFVRLDTTFFTPELLYCHIKPELLDETNRCAVLEQLHPPQNVQFDLLSECDFNALLMFFHAGINSTSNRDTYIRKLKSLPLFEPVQGGRQRIDRYRNVLILNTDLLHTFPDLYLIDDNSVFLKYNSINLHLSTAMDITVLNDVEFYVKFILPSLGRLTEDQTLDTVRMLLEIQKYPDYMQYKDPIISCLRKVRFIRNVNGELQDASYFYDKEVEFYQLMLPQERFIPATFWNLIGYKPHKVKRLLKDLGLKHTVSEEELLHFAHQIENEVKGNVCLGQLQLKSAALLEHLGNKKQEELQAVFLKRLSTIKFVFPKKIQDELCKFHRPFAGGRDVVAICGSLIKGDPNHELLIWTTVPILPLENSNENYLKILKSAGAVSQPPTAHVIENLTNICQAPCQACDVIQTRCKVLRFSYGYLQTVEFDPKPLSDISLVLVEGGATLVKPSCTVLTVRDDTEFRPYLYKLPPKLALYEEFFCKVGVAETPSSRHYSRLLQDVHEDTSDKQKLNANQIKAVTRTVEHLFLLLKEKPEERKLPHLQPLYLPATDDRLHASDSLYFNDTAFPSARCEPPLGKKVKLLEKLVKCYLGHDLYEHQKLLQLLPLQVRPKMFSQVITEDLLESSLRLCEYGEHCRFRGYFLSRLSSSYFQYGLICLIRRKTSGKVSESDAVKLCEDTFSKIQMNCCERLETTLLFNSEPLPETSAVKLVCLKRNPQGCVFYLEHNEELNVRAITQINGHLLREINSLLNNVLNLDTVHILGELLVCENLESVVQVLQDNGIHDCKVKENEQSGLPKPGSLIPDEWIHALDMDFLNNFEKGEYVGFKSPSPDEVYCYAVVVDRLNTITSQGEPASQRYKIDIGTAEFVVVSSLDLHQIKRPKRAQSAESTCRDLVLSDCPIDPTPGPTRTPRKSLQEIKKEVDECLRQVWDLPEEERRKAIRRLYLKWHPDKYTECVSLATKVSQYIQQRVKDLEEGRLMTTSGFESARANWNQSYGGFYQQWDREASRHQRGRARFYQNFPSQDYNFWTFHGGERSQQPSPEAKRWFRQAQCDLAAASHDSGGKASEWFFFKVHQAVEKALIAVKYKKTGQQPTNCTIGNLGQQVAQYSTKLSTLPTIVNRLKEFGVHPKKTQYPNYYPLPLIPNDQFSPQNENLVLELATELLRKTQAYISD
ncbi:sacsin [Amia ocellicauda]|uniref:sacsin n=1 Tax=Amia ocellicauda TaxID=2972642 RepID=UPI003464C1BD